jgi:multidrug resistance efflux pump
MAVVTERAEPQLVVPDEALQPQPEPKPTTRRWLYAAGILLIVAAAAMLIRALPRFTAGPPPRAVTASGRIEGRDVTVAPKDIQGRVKRLLVDEGDTVKKGQLLAELEANALDARAASLAAQIANIDAQIGQATLDVSLTAKNSDASIAAAGAVVSSAQAHIARAKAVLANATADYRRGATLLDDKVISRREFDQMEMALRTSEADVDAAEKELARALADLALARASKDTIAVKRQQVRAHQESRRAAVAQLAEAQANLAERQVVAPADGTILSRPVEVGDVVAPGSPIVRLVDLSRLYVKVYIPEPDIPKIKLGDPADVTVDAFPGRRFAARVSKIHDQAEFTPKNVETTEERLKLVFGVELTLVNPDRLLKPGMPADCTIHWAAGGATDGRHGA